MAINRLLEAFILMSVLTLAIGACENCANCQGSNTCLLCNHGYYLINAICTMCEANCTNCLNENECAQCLVGFYLDADTGSCLPCKLGCKSCDSYEMCRICEDKYFLDDAECLNCPITCSTCFSLTRCTSCYRGFWGSSNCSNSCLGGCKDNICDITGFCLECPDGTWGKECQYSCPKNCLGNTCSLSGSCTEGCTPGFYGRVCEISCPYNCQTRECSGDGICTTGCKTGFHGGFCNQTCSSNACPTNECFQDNGSCVSICPETCAKCASLTSCTSCEQGSYGTICENRCPDSNCGECTKETGTCLKCNDGLFLSGTVCMLCAMECETCVGPTSSNCLSCAKGYYLDTNKCKPCNGGCSDCTRSDNCEACQVGYFLVTSECIQCPPNCKTCISTNQCTSCIDGYQGIACASVVCADQKYSSSLGTDSCECDKQKCSTKNGDTCLACTDAGWYPSGPGCCPCAAGSYEYNGVCVTCPEHCKPQGQCNVSTGACVEGCADRWWGQTCDQRCNDTCKSCSRNGTCDPCIVGRYSEPECSSEALPEKDDVSDSNTVIIAAAGGGGAVFLIIIVVVIICVVRRQSSKKTNAQQQNGNATTQNCDIADNGHKEGEDEYTLNSMYVPLTETQVAEKGYTPIVQYDNCFSVADERNTTDVDTGHYSFADKSGNKAATVLESHVNQYDNNRGLADVNSSTNEVSETGHYSCVGKSRKVEEPGLDSQSKRNDTSPADANNSTNETPETGHYSIVDKYQYEMAVGSDAVYSIPNRKSKAKQSENL